MSSYLYGDFSDGATVTAGCYGYVIVEALQNGASYPLSITVYSDAEKKTAIYSRSDMTLKKLSTDDSDDSNERRALTNFKDMLAPGMALITEVQSTENSTINTTTAS